MHLGNLWRLSAARTRSLSAENPTGAKGAGRHGHRRHGRRGRPRARAGLEGLRRRIDRCLGTRPSTLADIAGPGAIQHIWLTVHPRALAVADLALLLGRRAHALSRSAAGGFLLLWLGRALPGEFAAGRRQPGGRVQLLLGDALPTSRPHHPGEPQPRTRWTAFYYQIDLRADRPCPTTAAYLHAQWRRSNPLPYMQVHTVLDGRAGPGALRRYLSWPGAPTTMAGGAKGEIKFYLDGDTEWPTHLWHRHRGLLRRCLVL